MPSAKEVVREVFAAFARRDLPAILAACAPDVGFWPEGPGGAAGRSRTEPYRGHAGMAEYLADVAAVWERLEVDPRDLRAAGAGGIALWHAARAGWRGPWPTSRRGGGASRSIPGTGGRRARGSSRSARRRAARARATRW